MYSFVFQLFLLTFIKSIIYIMLIEIFFFPPQNLINRSSDITRETVQKSVCVLSRVPLYGLIQAKLELITHAYFDERDFSKVSLLEETYKNLNSSLPKDLSDNQQTFLGKMFIFFFFSCLCFSLPWKVNFLCYLFLITYKNGILTYYLSYPECVFFFVASVLLAKLYEASEIYTASNFYILHLVQYQSLIQKHHKIETILRKSLLPRIMIITTMML